MSFFLIFIFLLINSCASSLNPRNMKIELDHCSYIHPFINEYEPGSIFLFNPNGSPKLDLIYTYEWRRKALDSNEDRRGTPDLFYKWPLSSFSYIESSYKGLGTFADLIFIEVEAVASSISSVGLIVSKGFELVPKISHQTLFFEWKENDLKEYNKFKDILYKRKGEKEGTLVILARLGKAESGKYSIMFKDDIRAQIKEGIKAKLNFYGGILNTNQIEVTGTPERPFPCKWCLFRIDLE